MSTCRKTPSPTQIGFNQVLHQRVLLNLNLHQRNHCMIRQSPFPLHCWCYTWYWEIPKEFLIPGLIRGGENLNCSPWFVLQEPGKKRRCVWSLGHHPFCKADEDGRQGGWVMLARSLHIQWQGVLQNSGSNLHYACDKYMGPFICRVIQIWHLLDPSTLHRWKKLWNAGTMFPEIVWTDRKY
jgi:hypothetical protein